MIFVPFPACSITTLIAFSCAMQKGKAWMMQLLAVACLSLAAKMEETEIPLCVELQVKKNTSQVAKKGLNLSPLVFCFCCW